MIKKILTLVLTLAMVFTGFVMPTDAIAKNSTKVEKGNMVLPKRTVVSIAESVMETDKYVEGQLLVVLKPEFSSKQAVFSTSDFPEVKAIKVENTTYCEKPDSDLLAEEFRTIVLVTLKQKTEDEMINAIEKLMEREDVESVSLNEAASATGIQTVPPSDSQYNNQWALEKIDAMGAWSKTTGSSDVKVGIIDSGIDYTHEELAANMWKNPGEIPGDGIDNDGNGYVDDVYGWNFYNNNNEPTDSFSHGTFCAGIIAADLNHKDVAGIAPNVKLISLKVGNEFFYYDAIIKAVNYASNMGIDILNYSASGRNKNTAFEAAIRNYDGIFVKAASNDGSNNDITPDYPRTSEFTNIIKVANSTSGDVLSSSSNYGQVDVTLAAPGSGVISTGLNNTYRSGSGTSFAAPYVAGVAALIKSQYPKFSTSAIIDSIKEGVDKLESLDGKVETGGRLNANKALEFARFRSLGWQVRYCMDVYNYDDFKEAMENDYYSAVRIFNDIEIQGDVTLTRSKMFFGGDKLKSNGKWRIVIDPKSNVLLDLGGNVYENCEIDNKSSNFQLEGSGAVIRNGDSSFGGAINNSGTMTATGVRIENCRATLGGGIYNTGTMNLKDMTIYKSRATAGGAVYNVGTMDISGGIFKENNAQGSGGALYSGSNSQITVSNTPYLINNTASYYGGGLYTGGVFKTSTPSGLKITDNNAQSGGGIYAQTGAEISLSGVSPGGPSISISSNTASQDGGGIYLNSGAELYLHNAFVAVNKAGRAGGGMLSKGTYTYGFAQFISNSPSGIENQ
ncbi:MAG: S8 family serine peptidase [Eubacterium sp.]|nr:S8 family serine peptidase [Eubacterium sp.]